MAPFFQRVRHFLSELRRRNVYRVAATYIVVGFFVIEAADLTLTRLGLPGWTVTFVVVLVGLGFPIALVMAWALEVTPDGVRVEEPEGSEEGAPAPASTTRNLWVGMSVLALFLLAGSGLWYLNAGSGMSPGDTGTAADTTQSRKEPPSDSDTPRVAVLPFENIARDSANAFFARGMHEEVLNQLAKISGLEVVSRTSVMGYQHTEKQVPEISQDLGGVSALLEGTVRRVGDQVRITTQLIEAPEDEHLWSETYDRRLVVEEIFDIQADIAQEIAGALKARLTKGERRRIEDAPTEDLAAYDAYLKGLNSVSRFYGTWKPDQLEQAIRYFRKAVRRDPSFAEAHARLAEGHRMRYTWFSENRRLLDSVKVGLARARAIDPSIPEVHWVQGFVHTTRDSLAAAAAAFHRALDLQPSNAIACSGLSTVRTLQDRLAEAVQWAHRAYRLEPGWSFRYAEMGDRLRHIGMIEEAEAWFEAGLAFNRDYLITVVGLTMTQISKRPQQAMKTMEAFLDRHPDHPDALAYTGMSALAAGRPEQAKSYLVRVAAARRDFFSEGSATGSAEDGVYSFEQLLLGLAEQRTGRRDQGQALLRDAIDPFVEAWPGARGAKNHLWRARGLGALGRKKEALAELREAMKAGVVNYRMIGLFGFFGELQSSPRFQDIVGEMKAKQAEFQDEVRTMEMDLYPPRAKPGTPNGPSSTDE